MPRVSVIIPTFNCAAFLERALKSVFAQTFTDCEVIIADDGSTDHTWEVVAPYSGKIRYFYQSNRGLSAARNLALSKASGEFIAYLDADDMWYPQKLERQVAFLEVHRECGMVHSDFTVVDEADCVIHQRFNMEKRREVPQGLCMMDLLRRCHIQVPTVVERNGCLQKIGQFDERLRAVEDYHHWILLAMEGFAVGYIDEALAMYRWRVGSISSSRRRMLEGFLTMFEILLREKQLAARCGDEAADILRSRLYALQRNMAYLDRTEGHSYDATRRVLGLIREKPYRTELYVDLFKSIIPPVIAAKLRRLRVGRTDECGWNLITIA
jgi:glycosyltransferase involved in cell wall biosynthesis